jgi:hypothetical protein
MLRWFPLAWLLFACAPDGGLVPDAGRPDAGALDVPAELPDAGPPEPEPPYEVVVDVGPDGPFGTHVISVPARANWVLTGLYLRAGESATFAASGTWSARGVTVGPEGDPSIGEAQRGCPVGALAVRSGLRFEDTIACLPGAATYVAPRDGIVYVGMIESTDLGEAYHERLDVDGTIEVTITSVGATVPSVRAGEIAAYPFEQVASGWVELLGAHHRVVVPAAQALADRATAASSLGTLDRIYEIERGLRSGEPFFGQRIRWFPDDTLASIGYMLAGNPIRCVPELMTGNDRQRILRASEGPTDIWGFSHELGHVFSFVDGVWVYQYVNVESWPNIFTLRALRTLGRTTDQPNLDTYCAGRDAYLAGGPYETFRNDPFVQLCFLMEFEETYGAGFYERFFAGLNGETNEDVRYDGTDASVWRYVKSRFDLAAEEDTAALWTRWRVPL